MVSDEESVKKTVPRINTPGLGTEASDPCSLTGHRGLICTIVDNVTMITSIVSHAPIKVFVQFVTFIIHYLPMLPL